MNEVKTPRILIRKMYEIQIAMKYEIDSGNNRIPVVQKILMSWEQEVQRIREEIKAAALVEVD